MIHPQSAKPNIRALDDLCDEFDILEEKVIYIIRSIPENPTMSLLDLNPFCLHLIDLIKRFSDEIFKCKDKAYHEPNKITRGVLITTANILQHRINFPVMLSFIINSPGSIEETDFQDLLTPNVDLTKYIPLWRIVQNRYRYLG